MKLFALCTLYSSVQAFPLLVPASLGHRHNERGTSATRLDVSAEEHLAQIKGDFDELQNMAKTLEVTHDEVRTVQQRPVRVLLCRLLYEMPSSLASHNRLLIVPPIIMFGFAGIRGSFGREVH